MNDSETARPNSAPPPSPKASVSIEQFIALILEKRIFILTVVAILTGVALVYCWSIPPSYKVQVVLGASSPGTNLHEEATIEQNYEINLKKIKSGIQDSKNLLEIKNAISSLSRLKQSQEKDFSPESLFELLMAKIGAQSSQIKFTQRYNVSQDFFMRMNVEYQINSLEVSVEGPDVQSLTLNLKNFLKFIDELTIADSIQAYKTKLDAEINLTSKELESEIDAQDFGTKILNTLIEMVYRPAKSPGNNINQENPENSIPQKHLSIKFLQNKLLTLLTKRTTPIRLKDVHSMVVLKNPTITPIKAQRGLIVVLAAFLGAALAICFTIVLNGLDKHRWRNVAMNAG